MCLKDKESNTMLWSYLKKLTRILNIIWSAAWDSQVQFINCSIPISFLPCSFSKVQYSFLPNSELRRATRFPFSDIAQTRMQELNKGLCWERRNRRDKDHANSKSGFQDMACFLDPFHTSSVFQVGRSLSVSHHQLSSRLSSGEWSTERKKQFLFLKILDLLR